MVVAFALCVRSGFSAVYASAFDDTLETDSESDSIVSDVPDVSDTPDTSDVPDAPGTSDSSDFSPADSVESVTVSGSDVHVLVHNNDTLSVPSSFSIAGHAADSSEADSSGGNIRDTLVSLFGSYTPHVQTVTTYYNGEVIASEEQVIPGLGGIDFEWLASVGLFALMLWCFFRFVGGLIKHG